LNWHYRRFDALSVDDLYDLLALRSEVFVIEQRCVFQDADGHDRRSGHLLGRNADGQLQAYLRVVDPGVKFPQPSLGRVITAAAVRGQGLGHGLVAQGIACCLAAWPGQAIRISAQSRLAGFYASHGFVRQGSDYGEDGIPHCEMLRPGLATLAPSAVTT
jgi:ElaA protein